MPGIRVAGLKIQYLDLKQNEMRRTVETEFVAEIKEKWIYIREVFTHIQHIKLTHTLECCPLNF